jgi:hypothetical protein
VRRGLTTGWLPAGLPLRLAVRVVGAGLLLGMAWIHQHLYDMGYATVPTIGPLFRLNAVLGLVAALLVLLVPMPWWRLACAAGALLQIGTLGALVQSLTIGAFGFKETLDAPYIPQTFAVEILGFLVLAVGALVRPARPGARSERRHHELRGDGRRPGDAVASLAAPGRDGPGTGVAPALAVRRRATARRRCPSPADRQAPRSGGRGARDRGRPGGRRRACLGGVAGRRRVARAVGGPSGGPAAHLFPRPHGLGGRARARRARGHGQVAHALGRRRPGGRVHAVVPGLRPGVGSAARFAPAPARRPGGIRRAS